METFLSDATTSLGGHLDPAVYASATTLSVALGADAVMALACLSALAIGGVYSRHHPALLRRPVWLLLGALLLACGLARSVDMIAIWRLLARPRLLDQALTASLAAVGVLLLWRRARVFLRVAEAPDAPVAPSPEQRPIELLQRELGRLREQHGLVSAIVDGMPDAAYVKDSDGRYLFINNAAALLVGRDAVDILGHDDTLLFPADEARTVMAEDRLAMQFGLPRTYEERVTTVAGEVSTFVSTKGQVKDERGAVIGLYGVARDVTALRLIEAARHRSERDFRQLADSMPQIVWACGPDGRNIYFNRQWPEYTGLTLQESLGHGWAKAFHPDEQQAAWDAWQDCVRKVVRYSVECRLRRADGAFRWWLMRAVPMRGEGDTIDKWFGTFTDIDDIKRAELARQERQEVHLDAALASMTDAVLIAGADGSFHEFNEAFAAFHRFGSREDCCRCMQDYAALFLLLDAEGAAVPPEEWPLARALRGESAKDAEYTLRRRDGGDSWDGAFNYAPIRDRDGRLCGCVVAARDITDSRRLLRAVSLSEERLKLAAGSGQVGIWELNLASGELIWNPTMYALYATTPDECPMTLDVWRTKLHPADLAPTQVAFRDALAGTREYNTDFRVVLPDGGIRYIKGHAQVIRDADGTALRVVGTNWDNSAFAMTREQLQLAIANALRQRQIAEQAIRAKEQRFQDVAKASADWVWELDAEYRYTFVSDSVETVLGYTPAAVIGRTPFDFMPREEAGRLRAGFDALRIHGRPVRNLEAVHLHVSGARRYMLTNALPVRDTDGGTIGFRGVDRDVTEIREKSDELERYRHRLEELVATRTAELVAANEQIRVSEERFAQAIDATNDGVWDWNIQSGASFCNAAYCAMLGYAPGGLGLDATAQWLDRLHPDERDEVVARSLRMLQEQGGYEQEFRMRTRDGGYKWILSRAKVVERDAAGHPLRAVGTHTDLTARKQMEIALGEAKATAEASNRAKSIFLANMSHEIRTPMNSILGFTRLLQRDVADPRQLDKLRKIDASGEHLLALINDILDLSKIEADQLQLEEAPLNVAVVSAHVCSIMADRVAAKGLALIEEVDPQLAGLTLVGDGTRLRQLLINYVGNAVKFTERGRIVLRTRLQERLVDGAFLRFEVEDTGIGIAVDQQQRLFEPFEQAESSTTRKYGGSGLGLSINRRLAALMGGEVGVQSSPGHGSLFWFTARLHAAGELPLVAETTDVAPRLRGGARVLVVEDNEINQEVAGEILREAGLLVDVAIDGGQAVALVQRGGYDLVLMDMQMPVMDGLEATRRIRLLEQGRSVPIVAMTANAFEDDRRRCLEAGMNDHVSKPFDPQHLYRTLARWIPANAPTTVVVPADAAMIDESSGLHYVGGRAALYLRMLARFADQRLDDGATVGALLESGDRVAAGHLAHDLKGVAATLGMATIARQAGALQNSLATDVPIEALRLQVQALNRDLSAVAREIRARLSASPR